MSNCPLCGTRLSRKNKSRDHFIPKSKGGTNDKTNIWKICRRCNVRKGNRMPNDHEVAEFFKYQRRLAKALQKDAAE